MCVLLLRFLTYCYLLAFNAWLLLAPIVLCYDWQVGSIPLVETAWDTRNAASLLLALGLLALCLHCLLSLQVSKAHTNTHTHTDLYICPPNTTTEVSLHYSLVLLILMHIICRPFR